MLRVILLPFAWFLSFVRGAQDNKVPRFIRLDMVKAAGYTLAQYYVELGYATFQQRNCQSAQQKWSS